MILTAHQPVYLPWLGLFHKIALSDLFCFFEVVQYQRSDWNNRNKIRYSSSKADWISVPVLKKNFLERSYVDIRIDNEYPWRRKHWRSIELSYCKAPYFGMYRDDLKAIYDREWEYLVDLNYELLLLFLRFLNIPTKVVRMRDYSFKGEKSDLVLDMCRHLGADVYIFGANGKDYADVPSFYKGNVLPYFQNYSHPVYPQSHGKFFSHLAIIDLLFNCGNASYDILMSGNITRSELEAWADSQSSLLCSQRKDIRRPVL